MDIETLIKELEFLKQKFGNLTVTLDDLYTPASLMVDNLFVEPLNGMAPNQKVVVIRA